MKTMKKKTKNTDILFLSPSSLNTYSTCPLLYKNKKTNKQTSEYLYFGSWIHDVIKRFFDSLMKLDILQIAKSTFTDYHISVPAFITGNKILKGFLEREYVRGLLDGRYKILAHEVDMKEILPSGLALRGIMDLIIERDADTIEIIDFKSGFQYYSLASLNKNVQLKLYKALVLAQPEYKKYKNFILTIDPLRYEPISIISDEMDDDVFSAWLQQKYLQIIKDKEFKPNFPNMYCKNCPITALCKDYQNLSQFDFKQKKSHPDRIKHFYQLKNLKKIVDNDIDFYQNYLKCYFDEKNITEEKTGGYFISAKNNKITIKEF